MYRIFLIFFLLPVFIFGQKPVTVEDPLRLHKDTIKSRTKIIDAIFLQDHISLLVGSNGCFHSTSIEYTFIKKAGYFEAAYVKKYNQDKNAKCKGTVKLDIKKMEAIRKLCIYALNIQQRLCTTQVDFELSTKDKKVAFEDDRCAGDDDIMNKIGEIVGVCKDF